MKDFRIGIDLGGTGIKAGVIDQDKKIICKVSIPTGADRPFEQVVSDMARAASLAAEQAGMKLDEFRCVGCGMPGVLDAKNGIVKLAGNLGWENTPILSELKKHITIPVFIGNDANCAVIGEAIAGAASGYDNVLMLTLGTGVGGGIILNRKLFVGGDGMGAELGHMHLRFGGEHCTCGIDGCLEAYASVTALIHQTEAAMQAHPETAMHAFARANGGVDGRTSFTCAQQGDAIAAQVVEQYMRYLAAGIGSYVSIFRPDIVLLGGGLSNQGENLLQPLRVLVREYVFAGNVIGIPPIKRATLGNDAGIYGAAFLDEM